MMKPLPRAFTLIEMMVAVSIFTITMLIGVGALLSLSEADKRAQAINAVMNNVNAAVETMSRTIRVGTTYHCEAPPAPYNPQYDVTQVRDCASGSGGTLIALESSTGDSTNPNDQVIYRLNGTQIERSLQSGAGGTWVALTAPEVSITSLQLYVVGTANGDGIQPRVLMLVKGSAKIPGGTTTFTIQSSVTQRLLDI